MNRKKYDCMYIINYIYINKEERDNYNIYSNTSRYRVVTRSIRYIINVPINYNSLI